MIRNHETKSASGDGSRGDPPLSREGGGVAHGLAACSIFQAPRARDAVFQNNGDVKTPARNLIFTAGYLLQQSKHISVGTSMYEGRILYFTQTIEMTFFWRAGGRRS